MIQPSRILAMSPYIMGDPDNDINSAIVVTRPSVMDGNLPSKDGVYDAHMGTTTDDWKCQTCRNTKPLCPGHYGVYRLRYPIIQPVYINHIIDYIRIICPNCGDLLYDLPDYKVNNIVAAILKDKKTTNKRCVNCKHYSLIIQPSPKTTQSFITVACQSVDGTLIKNYRGVTETRRIYPTELRTILSRITEETLTKLGRGMWSHPMKMISSSLLVLPNTSKPNLDFVGNLRKNVNPATSMTVNIIRTDQLITKDMNIMTQDEELKIQSRDHFVYSLITQSKQSNIRDSRLDSIADRIRGKFGRIRANLLGKRCDESARGMLSGENSLEFDEVGIPIHIAMTITMPEIVRATNIARLRMYVANGAKVYPGCISVIRGGRRYDAAKFADMLIEYGDTVERHIINGDIVNFNRQPSNHPFNIMSFRVRVHLSDTIQLNVSICQPFTADFDGDAGNIYFSRRTSALIDIKYLSSVERFSVSTQSGRSLIGYTQDPILGCSAITKRHARMNMSTYNNITARIKLLKPIAFDGAVKTGRDVLSIGLPVLNYSNRPEYYKEQYIGIIDYKPEDIQLNIVAGRIESGIVDGSSVGQLKPNSMFRSIQYTHSNRIALDAAFNVQQIASMYLVMNGASVGLCDVLPSVEARAQLDRYVSGRLAKTQLITNQLLSGSIVPPVGMTTEEFCDIKYTDALAADQELYGICLSNLNLDTNGFYAMTSSGAKANDENMLAIVGAKGQVSAGQMRIAQMFSYRRTTPHFHQFSPDPMSRGYIADSYMRGIRPQSIVFDCMVARHGFSQAAIKTSVVGYQAKKNRKCLELHVANNLFQLAKGTRIVQASYGGDGFDCTKMLRTTIPLLDLTDEEFATHNLDAAEFVRMTHYRDVFRENAIRLNYGFNFAGDMSREMPFRLDRIYTDIRTANIVGKTTKAAIGLVAEFMDSLPYVYTFPAFRKKNAPTATHIAAMQAVIGYVCLGMCLSELTRNSIPDTVLPQIFDVIRMYCNLAFIQPGCAIGQIAAMAISEPWVQYTLHSKRRAGIVTGTQTDKLTRMVELLSGRTTDGMSCAHMTLYTTEPMALLDIQKLSHRIHETRFENLVESCCDLYDPPSKLAYPEYIDEQAAVTANIAMSPPVYALSDFCCRFVLNRTALNFRNISISDILAVLSGSGVYPIAMNINAPYIVIRVYLYIRTIDIHDILKSLTTTREYIMSQLVSGIAGIRRTYVSSKMIIRQDASGKVVAEKVNYITTDGTNLMETLFNFPELDASRSSSDSVSEVTELYGINAGVQKIIAELHQLNETVHIRHYMEIADELGYTGTITSSDIGGVRHREPSDILLASGISDAVRVLTKGAVNSVTNNMDSMTANLMLGQLPKIGTHYNDICINEQFVADNQLANLDDL